MKFLLDNNYAPTTFCWGFIEAPFEKATGTFESWSASTFGRYDVEFESVRHKGTLVDLLDKLYPVTGPANREILMETNSRWTAYFDNMWNGGDPISRVGQMCDMLKCRGVAVTCSPHRNLPGDQGVFGAVQLQLFAPHETDFMNHLRYVGVTSDGDKWEFSTSGEVQPFEETLEYCAGRIRDRFTSEMLERYCRALGIDLFNPDFYGPNAVMIVNKNPLRPGSPCLSREEALDKFGLA